MVLVSLRRWTSLSGPHKIHPGVVLIVPGVPLGPRIFGLDVANSNSDQNSVRLRHLQNFIPLG